MIFTIDGVKFSGSHLPPFISLRGLAILAPLLTSVFGSVDWKTVLKARDQGREALEGAVIDNLEKVALSSADHLKVLLELQPLLLAVYEVELKGPPALKGPLSELQQEAFGGKTSLQLAWLLRAIKEEYSDFLAKSVLNTFGGLVDRSSSSQKT